VSGTGSGEGGRAAAGARRAVVIVASTSAAAGESDDRTGPVIRRWLLGKGFEVETPLVVSDGEATARAVRAALETGPSVIITTGGTGVSPSDRTPEAVSPLLDAELPGVIEELRRRGRASTPMSIITRGVAGFSGDTFIATLPGSPGGVRDGLSVLDDVLTHLIGQRTEPYSRERSPHGGPHDSDG